MVETLLIALGPGTFEGLLAVAIVVTYRSTRVVNVALGSIGAVGAVLAAFLAAQILPAAALVAGIVISAVCASALTAAVSRYEGVRGYPWSLLITAAVAVALGYALDRTWDSNRLFPAVLPDRLIGIGSYQITPLQLTGVVSGVLITGVAAAFLRTTPRTASSRSPLREPTVWVVLGVGAVAGFCACLLAEAGFGPGFMLVPTLVAVLAACIARFRSPEIAFLAAVVVEVVRNLTIHFKLPHSGYTVAFVAALLLAAAVYLLQYAAIRLRSVSRGAPSHELDY